MQPPPPQYTLSPEIERLLVQFRARLKRDLKTQGMSRHWQEIQVIDEQLSRAAKDPAHPLRQLLLLAEAAGYERGHRWVEEVLEGSTGKCRTGGTYST